MSLLAVCPCNNEIWIFDTGSSQDMKKWTKIAVLKEHFNEVTALEWNPRKQNQLLSASADRGAIVWEERKDASGNIEFTPQMGII